MNKAHIARFFATLQAANPHPQSELHWRTPFELLAAVMLSAQATDASVNRATPALFAAAPTPEKMVALGAGGIERFIKSIGLYRSKARHLLEASQLLIERHGGEVPAAREALEALPGVGRKTANVILNVAFGEPAIAVDTHVYRVSCRTGLASCKTPLAVEQRLLARVPKEYLQHAHHWLILLGRYTCQARKPRCWQCPVAQYCDYKEKTPAPAGKA